MPGQVSDRVLTLPNVLSVLRLAGVPIFLWLVLGPHADAAAFAVLVLAGATDWLDGKLARAWGQVSRVGQLLDPLADRLYIVAIVVAFVLRDILPWWLAAALVGRDIILGVAMAVLRHYGHAPPLVHFLGKAATFNLLCAFPLLLLAATTTGAVQAVASPLAWAFTVWGSCLYWWAGLLYLAQVGGLIADARRPHPESAL